MGDILKYKTYSTENLRVEWAEPKIKLPTLGSPLYDIFNYTGKGCILEFGLGFSGHEVLLTMVVDGVTVMDGFYIEMIKELNEDYNNLGGLIGYSKNRDSFVFKRPIKYGSSFKLSAVTNDSKDKIEYHKSYIIREVYL